MERSRLINAKFKNISIVTIALGFYFMMMPFDSIPVFGMGSLLRIIVLLPVCAIIVIKFRHTLQINALTVMCMVYCLSLTVSYFYSIRPDTSFTNLKRVLLNMGVILCVGAMYDYNEDEIEFLKKSLVIGGLGTLALTLVFADFSKDGRLTLKVNGNTQDQNYLNGYLFFAYVYFLTSLVKKKNILYGIPVLGIIYFTLLTGSRGALAALAGISVVTVFYILYKDKKLKLGTILLVAVIGAVLIILLYEPVLSILPEAVSKRFSIEYIKAHGNTGRTQIWRHLIRKFIKADLFRTLFGYGYATVVFVNEYNHLVAHNLWLDHLIMVGVVGELIFVGMQIVFLRAAWKSGEPFLVGTYTGFLIMMLVLSLLSYKPIWNCMMMIMIITNYQKRQAGMALTENANGS